MAVRNFWIEADINGRATTLAGGPAAKDGGMRVKLLQREDGAITTAFVLDCQEVDGMLITTVKDECYNTIAEFRTKR